MVGFNTQLGIQLAQQGRKAEALPYLRHAVLTEPITAEVWLWLAYSSPELAEYRNCVHQALILNPMHPTALRMQQDLDFQSRGMPPPITAPPLSQAMDYTDGRGRRLRRILILLIAIFLVVGCGLLVNRLSQEIDSDTLNRVIPFTAQTKLIQLPSIGDEETAYTFSAEIPRTWLPADRGSSSWRQERDRLQGEFPSATGNLWQAFEADWGLIIRNSTGLLSRSAALVETDSEKIAPHFPHVPHAQLVALRSVGDNTCESLRLQAGEEETTNATLPGFISTQVKQRDNTDCVYYSEFTETDAGTLIHLVQLYIPVQDDLLALWEIRIPESQYGDYQPLLEKMIGTLKVNDA